MSFLVGASDAARPSGSHLIISKTRLGHSTPLISKRRNRLKVLLIFQHAQAESAKASQFPKMID